MRQKRLLGVAGFLLVVDSEVGPEADELQSLAYQVCKDHYQRSMFCVNVSKAVSLSVLMCCIALPYIPRIWDGYTHCA